MSVINFKEWLKLQGKVMLWAEDARSRKTKEPNKYIYGVSDEKNRIFLFIDGTRFLEMPMEWWYLDNERTFRNLRLPIENPEKIYAKESLVEDRKPLTDSGITRTVPKGEVKIYLNDNGEEIAFNKKYIEEFGKIFVDGFELRGTKPNQLAEVWSSGGRMGAILPVKL